MASLADIGLAAVINILTAVAFLVAFTVLRLQPFNDRVYFPKWYVKGIRSSPTHSGAAVNKFFNLDCSTYIRFLNWMPAALRMPELELIDHAGLDSVAFIRIFCLGSLENVKEVTFSDIDKLSISNIAPESDRWCRVCAGGAR